jgi:AraC family transcriptional regulator, regulatory protein of adaptative response / DNA-3-methyladenine glycosylase II
MSDFRSWARRIGAMMGDVIDAFVLDPERCYRAAQSRDARFDGWFFVAVRTTGIYCRPSCPAITPKRSNVEFHRTAAAAQQRGFRACKRCRPDAAPGSPEWDVRGDVIARAMRLIGDGVVDRDGVSGLSSRLGYSERHLNRLLTAELGAGPLALARAQRAQTARILVETTELSMTDVAFAAGFGSVRQFNDTVREVYASSPTELRRRRTGTGGPVEVGTVHVRLPVRAPFAGTELFRFVGAHAVPGLVTIDAASRLHRSLSLPHAHGVVRLEAGDDCVHAAFRLADWRDLAPAVARVRRWLDLDADPVAIDAVLGADPALAPAVEALPGIRSPGSVDPFEEAIRTVVGQQVSVAGAATVTGRIVARLGGRLDDRLGVDGGPLTHVFPSPEQLACADPADLPLPTRRAATVQRLARAVVDGEIVLDRSADRVALRERLATMPGIGPWTIAHIEMRGLGDPDVWLDGDLVVGRGLERLGPTADPDEWRPWRSYATRHVWNTVRSPR